MKQKFNLLVIQTIQTEIKMALTFHSLITEILVSYSNSSQGVAQGTQDIKITFIMI